MSEFVKANPRTKARENPNIDSQSLDSQHVDTELQTLLKLFSLKRDVRSNFSAQQQQVVSAFNFCSALANSCVSLSCRNNQFY